MYRASATLSIPAETDEVWRYVSDYQNFGHFMTEIERVGVLEGEVTLWQMRGPLDIPVSWKATTTEMTPSRRLAWRSTEGDLEAQGSIRLEPDGNSTRVTLESEYTAPDETYAKLFGGLQGVLEKDLERLAGIAAGWPKEASPASVTPNPLESELVEKGRGG